MTLSGTICSVKRISAHNLLFAVGAYIVGISADQKSTGHASEFVSVDLNAREQWYQRTIYLSQIPFLRGSRSV